MENQTPIQEIYSLYDAWNDNRIGNFGSFQTTILQAYRIADAGNRRILNEAYPDWFTSHCPHLMIKQK